ncbi:hypothetical protein F443_22145 [Phytophthora nicotianae P1569]|uniref:SWIM-type domain-containing protein n=1 Tax=Phytophthora nicotianae P1569 TaxID=1317065 RepID=V9DV61_PHYNI|nr:hypothetical protein F443_22145 [Phytophthora nicotianae P1569]
METAGMPGSGWEVDVDLKICGCRIFFKSGYCIHLIHALSETGTVQMEAVERRDLDVRQRMTRLLLVGVICILQDSRENVLRATRAGGT